MASTSSSSSARSSLKDRTRDLMDGNDIIPFILFLDKLFSENPAVVGPAKSLYNDVVKEFPGALASRFATVLNISPVPQIRIRCSTLLAAFLAKSWPHINPIFRNEIKAVYIHLLSEETCWAAVKIHCGLISSLAGILFPNNEWPEMVTTIVESAASDSSTAQGKYGGLILLKDLIPKFPLLFSPSVDVLREAFHEILTTFVPYIANEDRIQIETIRAAVKLIEHFFTRGVLFERAGFRDLLLDMNVFLMDAVGNNECLAWEVLDEMTVLAKARPGFFQDHMNSLAESMLHIIDDQGLKPKTRELAVKFLVAVAEDLDVGCRMIQNLPRNRIKQLFAHLLCFLLFVEDHDESWGNADDDDTKTGKLSLACCAEEAWSKLAIALSRDVILANPTNTLAEYIESDKWKKRYAGATALGLIAQPCSKTLVKYLKESMEKIMGVVTDQHPRVRWAAIHTIGEFSKHLTPYLQKQYHQQVIPALLESMDDLSHSRLQRHATTALLIFSRDCSSDILKPYMKEIMSKLVILLQERKTMLVEPVLEVLASLASSTKDGFLPYYGSVMPYLKLILVTAKGDCDYMLVAKSLKCIAVIAEAVGKSYFFVDVEEVVKDLIFLQGSILGTEGEVRIYLLEAWGGLCRCLEEDFLPYLSVSMPQLIQSAKRTDFLTDDDNVYKEEILKEKVKACDVLGCFAAYVKGELHLWIKEAVDAVLPLVNFEFDDRVREAAIPAMPYLLQSASIAMIDKLPIPDFCYSGFLTLSETIISALLQALQKPSIKLQVKILEALNIIIQIPQTLIRKEMATLFVKGISKSFYECVMTKGGESIIDVGSDLKAELIKEKIRDVENLYREGRICLGFLIERLKASFLPLIDDLFPFAERVWTNDRAIRERRIGLSVFHDIAENCGEEFFMRYDMCIPFLLKTFKGGKATNPLIEEIAAYAIAICAEYGGQVFKPYLQDVLSSLEGIFHQKQNQKLKQQHSEEFDVNKMMAREAAISAYGKILFFFRKEIRTYRYVDLWLTNLPLKCNIDEARDAHGLLCSMIEKSETKVTGPNDGYTHRIISIMAQVLWAGKHLATEETCDKMIEQLRMFREREPGFKNMCDSLSPPYLTTMLRDILP